MKLEPRLAEVYAQPLERFTQARNALAAELKKAGHAAEAQRVKALAKPSAGVWAINQLARREPAALRALLDRGASLVAGQGNILRGQRADTFLDEARAERQEVAKLVAAAERILTEAGKKPTPALGRRIARTLHAAALSDSDTRACVLEARLEEDLEPPSLLGVGSMVVSPPAEPPPKHRNNSSPASDHAERTRLKAEGARARNEAARATRARARAADEQKAAQREVEQLEAEHARAERQARVAVERVRMIESKLQAARERLRASERG